MVVGVSRDPIKRGRQVVRNVMNGGFAGAVYAVGRGLDEADGARCVPDLGAVPGPVDVAFLAVGAETTAATLRQCRRLGVKAAIISAAGFAESGDEGGRDRQRELMAVAAEAGIRLVGPNCNGIYNTANSLALGFNAAHAVRLPQGGIAILSHSGALFSVMAGYLDKLQAGLSLFVSAGNEADLDIADYLDYAIDDPQTRVIALLIDSLLDGERFRKLALRAQARDKRIVALKVGVSEIGARAALAHSSRLAGSAEAYAALFAACGIARAASLEELMTTAALLEACGRASGGLGAFTTSGAGASLLADLAAKRRVPLPELADATRAKIGPFLQFSSVGNPVDLGIFERGKSAVVPSLVAADPGIGAMLALVNPLDPNSGVPTLSSDLAAAKISSGKPFAVVVPGGLSAEAARRYTDFGMQVFPDTSATIAALGALLAPPRVPVEPPLARRSALGERLLSLQRPLTEPESLALLGEFGIDVVPMVECATVDEMLAAAERFGWPVVAKAVVAGISHKTEAGLVRVDLRDAAALRAAFEAFGRPARTIVQPFIRGKAEAILGSTWSPDVGPILIAGLGGIYAEALRDIVMWSPPVSEREIADRLAASALGRLLTSSRWPTPNARDAVVKTLLRLQDFILFAADRVKAVDLNPLILSDEGAVAVDALIVPNECRTN